MIPGPGYGYECPTCSNRITVRSLMSGNTFGAKTYSDGKMIAPMLQEAPNLTKCKKCDTLFWTAKLPAQIFNTYSFTPKIKLEPGEEKPKEEPSPEKLRDEEWRKADVAEFLSIDEYFKALEVQLAENRRDEFYIRKQIWWAYNDRLRKGEKLFNDEQDELRWKENLHKLLNIIDMTDLDERIKAAEIYRNLGDFEKCLSIVETIDIKFLDWLKEVLTNECKLRNRWVVGLK